MIDVSAPIRPITDVGAYPRTRVLVQDGDTLLGSVEIDNARGPISATTLRHEIARSLTDAFVRRALARQLGSESRKPLDPAVTASIVIPTCGRVDDLRRCLDAVRAQDSERRVEVIVVDNRPGGPTPALVRRYEGVRLVEEHRHGLSYARNAGILAANGDILIAIDDDVVAPQGWLKRLLAPFASEDVVCVTGNVLPLELETEAQWRFEAYGGLGRGFERLRADGAWFRRHRAAVPTWILGATANAAFRASVFRDARIGLLDEALGAGMPTGCSEDTYLFYRILKQGHALVYEPSAWVWHRHRLDMPSLRKQIRAYSTGHVAYQLTTLTRERDRRAIVRLAYSLPRTYAQRAYARLRGRSGHSLSLIATEIAGNIAGPWALWRARRIVRRLGPSGRRPPNAVRLESPVAETSTH
jgi:GT2 family glycosyltransferase